MSSSFIDKIENTKKLLKKGLLKQFGGKPMSINLGKWSSSPKAVRLLDISILAFIIIFAVSILLYLTILLQSVQNLMIILLTGILLLLTWNFRTQLTKSSDPVEQRRYYREWVIICLLFIIIIGVLVIIYPVTY
jgi:uncharacterized membrane protein